MFADKAVMMRLMEETYARTKDENLLEAGTDGSHLFLQLVMPSLSFTEMLKVHLIPDIVNLLKGLEEEKDHPAVLASADYSIVSFAWRKPGTLDPDDIRDMKSQGIHFHAVFLQLMQTVGKMNASFRTNKGRKANTLDDNFYRRELDADTKVLLHTINKSSSMFQPWSNTGIRIAEDSFRDVMELVAKAFLTAEFVEPNLKDNWTAVMDAYFSFQRELDAAVETAETGDNEGWGNKWLT
jgi:hypothetical protein